MPEQPETGAKTTALKYGETPYEDCSYQTFNVNPDNGLNTVTINNATGQELIFSIPALTVFNPSKSFIEFTVTPGASGSSQFNFQWLNTCPFFQTLTVQPISGRPIQYNDLVHNKLAMQWPIKHDMQGLLTNPIGRAAASVLRGLRRTNGLTTSTTAGSLGMHGDGVATTIHYTEKIELEVGGSNTATPVTKWRLPLHLFGDFLACNRNVCFGESLQIKFITSPIEKCHFFSASATDPTSTPGSALSTVLSALRIDLAQVESMETTQKVQNMMRGAGIPLLIDNTVTTPIQLTGTSQNYTYNLSMAQGRRLKSMMFAPFQTETKNNGYLRNNVSGAIYTVLRTWMGGRYRQNNPLTIASFDDHTQLSFLLATSCYQSTEEFYHDTFWCDYFYDHKVTDPTRALGYVLQGNGNDTYMIESTTVSATNKWHFLAQYQRRLLIKSSEVLIS